MKNKPLPIATGAYFKKNSRAAVLCGGHIDFSYQVTEQYQGFQKTINMTGSLHTSVCVCFF